MLTFFVVLSCVAIFRFRGILSECTYALMPLYSVVMCPGPRFPVFLAFVCFAACDISRTLYPLFGQLQALFLIYANYFCVFANHRTPLALRNKKVWYRPKVCG